MGTARNNLVTQIPQIARGFPSIQALHPATINVRFEPKIIVAGWDHRTAPIRWAPDQPNGEVFDLVWVRLLFSALGAQVRALMYVAHWSPHRNDPHMHEFLAETFVQGLQHGMSVAMECSRPFIELPYAGGYQSVVPYSHRPRLAKTIVIR